MDSLIKAGNDSSMPCLPPSVTRWRWMRAASIKHILFIFLPKYLYLSVRLAAVDTLKRYSKTLEYEYRVKTTALSTLKRYSIISLTLYLECYCAYSILYSGRSH
jgi:hypothetical protein